MRSTCFRYGSTPAVTLLLLCLKFSVLVQSSDFQVRIYTPRENTFPFLQIVNCKLRHFIKYSSHVGLSEQNDMPRHQQLSSPPPVTLFFVRGGLLLFCCSTSRGNSRQTVRKAVRPGHNSVFACVSVRQTGELRSTHNCCCSPFSVHS